MAGAVIKRSEILGEEYVRFKHSSGLEVYIIPKDHKKSFALFGTRYGSIDRVFKTDSDSEFITVPDGIAHFLEHKLFENSDGVDTFSLFAKNGASCNAFTSNEMTAYLFSCTDKYYDNLEILLNFVTSPYFTPETVQKELGIIGQEIRMCNDDPFQSMYYGMLDCLYVNHNIKVDIAGTEETISHITADILYDCYKTFYNLGNMQLVLCGSWEMKKVKKVLDKVLKKAPKVKITRKSPSEPKRINKKYCEKESAVSIPIFAVGMKENDLPKRIKPEDILKKEAEHEIIADALFGKSSMLYSELYEKGIISDKFSIEYNLSGSYGYLMLYGESHYPKKVFAEVKKAIASAAEKITAEDFERSKRVVFARAIKDWNSTTEIAENFMDFSFSGTDMLLYPEAIKNISYSDIMKRIEKSYNTRYMALSVVKPQKKEK